MGIIFRENVFPTHVGVNRYVIGVAVGDDRIPHACGGEPWGLAGSPKMIPYSPRMWG
jgi:hypothetical protein